MQFLAPRRGMLLVPVMVAGVMVAGVLTLAGCSALGGEGSTSGRQVSAAFYPLQFAAERVAGDQFDVINLTSPGTEPHDLELSGKQTAQVAASRLVVFENGFQPAVDKAVEQSAEGDTLDAADVIELQPFEDHGTEDESHEGHEGH
ncbi:MAG: metal ABC transporter substrate-binding protein, partial [Nocardioides sp.]|nr:metal ABC transporter substrate-binding protein [Nocardioides sp.]